MGIISTLIISFLLSLGIVSSAEEVNEKIVNENLEQIEQYIDTNSIIITGDVDVY